MIPPAAVLPVVLGLDTDGRLAYALTFPFRSGWEAAVFWTGVLVALAWYLAQRLTSRRDAEHDQH